MKKQSFGLLAGCLILALVGGLVGSYLAQYFDLFSSQEGEVYAPGVFFQASLLREFQR